MPRKTRKRMVAEFHSRHAKKRYRKVYYVEAACRNEDAELFFPERTSPYAYALPRSICRAFYWEG